MTDPQLALVTGGAGGIGTSIVRRLVASGAHVVIADRDEHAAQAAARSVATSDSSVGAIGVDVTDEGSVSRLFEWLDRGHPPLGVLVNCAGVSPRVNGERPLTEHTPLEVWQRTLAINLTGTFLSCRAAIPRMKRGGGGRIVNIASIAARTVGEVTSCYYAASKSGVLAFSRVLASEVGRDGITVNCVSPSRVSTALTRNLTNSAAIDQRYIAKTPLGRLGQPEDVAGAVAFLLSDDASFLTGAIIDVTGGYFMP